MTDEKIIELIFDTIRMIATYEKYKDKDIQKNLTKLQEALDKDDRYLILNEEPNDVKKLLVAKEINQISNMLCQQKKDAQLSSVLTDLVGAYTLSFIQKRTEDRVKDSNFKRMFINSVNEKKRTGNWTLIELVEQIKMIKLKKLTHFRSGLTETFKTLLRSLKATSAEDISRGWIYLSGLSAKSGRNEKVDYPQCWIDPDQAIKKFIDNLNNNKKNI